MDEFKKELDEIKNELNEVKLSDEFKQNLKIKMEEEFDKPNIKEKARNILFPRKLIHPNSFCQYNHDLNNIDYPCAPTDN